LILQEAPWIQAATRDSGGHYRQNAGILQNVRVTLGCLAVVLLLVTASWAEPVKITKGPVVEHVDPTSATIAWSTNASSATIVRYGTDSKALTARAEMPWGALTHRVTLKNLQPATIYYFQADSSEGQGTGSEAMSPIETFTTTADGPLGTDHHP